MSFNFNLIIIIIITFLSLGIIGLIIFLFFKRSLFFRKQVERSLKMVPLLITVPKGSKEGSSHKDQREYTRELISVAEQLFSAFYSIYKKGLRSYIFGQKYLGFEIIGTDKEIQFYAAVPADFLDLVEKAITAQYPEAQVEMTEEHNIFSEVSKIEGVAGCELVLEKPNFYPIRTYKGLDSDPLNSITNSLSKLNEGQGAAVQILIRPAAPEWSKGTDKILASIQKGKKKSGVLPGAGDIIKATYKSPQSSDLEKPYVMTPVDQTQLEGINGKIGKPAFETVVRVVASANDKTTAQSILNQITGTFTQFNIPELNGFKAKSPQKMTSFCTDFIFRFFAHRAKMILNIEELASIFHLPNPNIETPNIHWLVASKGTAPVNLSVEGTLLGTNIYRGQKQTVKLAKDDKRKHAYIIGQTGTGKSTLMLNMVLDDIKNGEGVAVIDPHGELIEDIIDRLPKERAEDVVIFDAGDTERPLGLNLFEFRRPEEKDFLIQEAINMLYKLYDPGHIGIVGPRYEHWFRNAALTLMADPKGATFIEIPKVFIDQEFLSEKLKYVTDPLVLDFWNKEMAQTSEFHKSEILGWFISKFGAFMTNETMRNIIGQPKSSFDFREIMDTGKIFLVNLSKGRVGELNSMLLGMIFVMKIQMAAMSRADIPEEKRRDFFLYVDEFQNFSTDSFASILSEARKYHLGLIVANQFIGQLTDEIRKALFGNVGSLVSYRVSSEDAEFLSTQFASVFKKEDLENIENFNAYVKMIINGVPCVPFSMRISPKPEKGSPEVSRAIRELSRLKYGRDKNIVDAEIKERITSMTNVINDPTTIPRETRGS